MTVQLPNTMLGVERMEPPGVDAHGAPLPAAPGEPTGLLPGKSTELGNGAWQQALDPSLWPVRVGDRTVGPAGERWLVTSSKYIGTPQLTQAEAGIGMDLDVSFVRVEAQQVTASGTEPADGALVGRTGSPV